MTRHVSPARPASTAGRFTALRSDQRVLVLRRLVEAGRYRSIPAVVPQRDGDGPVRLSPAQEDLWVYESLYPGSTALILCAAYHFDRPVDPAQLEAALSVLQERHDILRARITSAANAASAVTDSTDGPGERQDALAALRLEFPLAPSFELERVDLRGTTGTLAEVFDAFRRRPYALDRDRLIRGQFVTVDDTRRTLILSLHHIIADWWSFDVLQAELGEAYRAVREGRPPRLARPAIQYADFACWQRELEAAGAFDAQLEFWRGYLAEPPPPIEVGPALAGGGSGPADGIAQLAFRVDLATVTAVRTLARERGATVYAVLMAAFAVFTHRLTGADDFVIGTPTANRAARGLERVIGYVMNVVPTRWRIRPEHSFSAVLAGFTAALPNLLGNADLPVGRIVADVRPERITGRSPLFQWVFMHLPRQPSVAALAEIADPERVHTGGEHDLLGVLRDDDDGGFTGSFETRTDVYDAEVVRRWTVSFTELLAALVANPDAPVGSVGSVGDIGAANTAVDGPGRGDETAPAGSRPPVPAPVAPPAVNRRERLLRTLFAELLDAPDIGPDDNFFARGGDSITVLSLIGRARAAGLDITPREVFTARTPAAIAALARESGESGDGSELADADECGVLPFTPIMHVLRAAGWPLETFTLAALLPTPAGLDRDRIAAALRTLVDRHGALRMRLLRDKDGGWEVEVLEADQSGAVPVEVERVDAAGMSAAEQRQAARQAAARVRLAVDAGQMLHGTWYDPGAGRDGLLLLTAHHVAVDAVSWHILVPELTELLTELLTGRTAPSTLPGTSFRRWARALHAEARRPRRVAELPLWERMLAGAEQDQLLPGSVAEPAGWPRAVLTVELPADRAAPVLTRVPATFHCGPDEVLLTALAAAVIRWRATSAAGGGSGVLVGLERHGRDVPEDGLGDLDRADVSRTVGWFTTRHPIRLDAGDAGEAYWTAGPAPGAVLKRVKEALRAIPTGGLGFGLLRYLNPDTAQRLARLPQPDLQLNYLGRLPGGSASAGSELLGGAAGATRLMDHAIELDVAAHERADGPHLVASWSYAPELIAEAEVRSLAGLWFDALTVLAEHAAGPDAGGHTGSDFPLVELTTDQVDALEADLAHELVREWEP